MFLTWTHVWPCWEWGKAHCFEKYSTCSCCFLDQTVWSVLLAEWWVTAECLLHAGPPLSRISSQQSCVFMYLFEFVCLWGTLCKRVWLLFSLGRSFASVKRFLLFYVGPLMMHHATWSNPQPFQNTPPALHGYSIFFQHSTCCARHPWNFLVCF